MTLWTIELLYPIGNWYIVNLRLILRPIFRTILRHMILRSDPSRNLLQSSSDDFSNSAGRGQNIITHLFLWWCSGHICISRRCNSWGRFRVQKSAILDTQIQMGVSQRVFIPSQASKYMLESKRKSFRKWKKFWSWATSFWSFGNFKKYAKYIFYIYALRGYSGWWSCPTSKNFFSENSLVYMLYIWHSGCIMKLARKWYFWSFLCPKISFFVIFAQMCPKKGKIWMVDITFFVFVVSRDWRYMLEGYYYTFKKIKNFWSWPTSVGPVHPSKSKTMKKQIFFSWFSILRGVQVLLKLANFKNFLFFWKYNSKPLTCIFNLARRQIQKKLCRPFKSSLFLGTFGQKWQKMRFSGIKMIKNIIFGLVSWYDHYARCKAYTLVNSQKKTFFEVGQLHHPL